VATVAMASLGMEGWVGLAARAAPAAQEWQEAPE